VFFLGAEVDAYPSSSSGKRSFAVILRSLVNWRIPRTSLRMLETVGEATPVRQIFKRERWTPEALPTWAGVRFRARMNFSNRVVAMPRYFTRLRVTMARIKAIPTVPRYPRFGAVRAIAIV